MSPLHWLASFSRGRTLVSHVVYMLCSGDAHAATFLFFSGEHSRIEIVERVVVFKCRF